MATKKLVQQIATLKPDVIHLHNIHDHWLNYRIFFEYLNSLETPIIWTQHDCWGFTGGCGYYTIVDCDKWKTECNNCIYKQGLLPVIERTHLQYETKKRLFCNTKNLTLVPVSNWLAGEISRSFLREKSIVVITNGVDTRVFQPSLGNSKVKYRIGDNALLVGVATQWSERKGLKDYIRLRELLSTEITIMLVGLSKSQINCLPDGMIGIERTNNVEELACIYSEADIVLNLSREETFGLTTVEGLACGTPGIVYNATASPELITPETGIVVEPGNIEGVVAAVNTILTNGKQHYSVACRKRAEECYDKEKCFGEYIKLYDRLLKKNTNKDNTNVQTFL